MKRSDEGTEYVYTIAGADDARRKLLKRLAGTEGVRAFSLE
jgi:hypothetical protein